MSSKDKHKHEHEEEDSLVDLANHMALCDIMRLIQINMDRIKVFDYENGHFHDIDTIGFNGAFVQITVNVDDE